MSEDWGAYVTSINDYTHNPSCLSKRVTKKGSPDVILLFVVKICKNTRFYRLQLVKHLRKQKAQLVALAED
jgi:hypothetical protein